MKNIILILIIFLGITGCQKSIVERNAMEISVENLKSNQTYKIINEYEIATIIDNINSSKKEFLIFKPDVKLIFIYSDGNQKTVLVKNNMLKIDGISYMNGKPVLDKYGKPITYDHNAQPGSKEFNYNLEDSIWVLWKIL